MDDNLDAEHPAGAVPAGLDSLEITIDAVDLEAAARFWSAALGYDRLYERPPYIVLGPPRGAGPRVLVQKVPAVVRGARVHLDLRVREPEREVERLVSLGATVDHVVSEAGTPWTVMADPFGTPFCVCPARVVGGAGRSAGPLRPEERPRIPFGSSPSRSVPPDRDELGT